MPRPIERVLLVVILVTSCTVLTGAGLAEAATVRYVSRTDASCGGRSPCYGSIPCAGNAARAGDPAQIQAGAYIEQVSISGKNQTAKSEPGRIVVQADPAARAGSVV